MADTLNNFFFVFRFIFQLIFGYPELVTGMLKVIFQVCIPSSQKSGPDVYNQYYNYNQAPQYKKLKPKGLIEQRRNFYGYRFIGKRVF